LIAAIQRDREKLLSEVKSIKLKQLKQVEMVKQEVKQQATALESFRRYSETLLSSGTDCDVTKSANSLHKRADELMKFDVIGHVDSSLPLENVTFTSSVLLNTKGRNLVGTVTVKGQSKHSLCRNKKNNITIIFTFVNACRLFSRGGHSFSYLFVLQAHSPPSHLATCNYDF